MCGICFIVAGESALPSQNFKFLHCRGPDCFNSFQFEITPKVKATVASGVLWLQGDTFEEQPVVDSQQNVLLWNGDILAGHKIPKEMSDTEYLSIKLGDQNINGIVSILQTIKGPWSLIYFQYDSKRLYFGRDVLGRHSLLWKFCGDSFMITSVNTNQSDMEEIPALGLYFIDICKEDTNNDINLIPWKDVQLGDYFLNQTVNCLQKTLNSPIAVPLLKTVPQPKDLKGMKSPSMSLGPDGLRKILRSEIDQFERVLTQSIVRRVKVTPMHCINCTENDDCDHTLFSVLFSGGLDSSVLALALSCSLPENESIDLLNVSFENNKNTAAHGEEVAKDQFLTPDRITGMICLRQLREIHPYRTWNFVEINVTEEELNSERNAVISHLIAPQKTVLDDSIGCALYFAARGKGIVNGEEFESSARIMFSGLGADEQLGGYARHRALLNNYGWERLIEELDVEVRRLHIRNLGRDNRVLAHHGRAPRYPFLDEDVISFLNSLPVWKKTNLFLPRGFGDKMLLRGLADKLQLTYAASQPKRAIQFGSRIAKCGKSKEKGSENCDRRKKASDICDALKNVTI